MLFSSVTFLYVFLPVVFLLYFLVPKAVKNYVLLAASLVFYFFGEPVYTLLLIFSAVSNWLWSLLIERLRAAGREKRMKAVLIASVVVNLGLLGFFKYADFLIATVNGIFGLAIPQLGVPLPIGISFFTFQTMSYTIDVYRGDVPADRNLANLSTYVSFFPQLIAGPIVRYTDVARELHDRRSTLAGIAQGVRRFVFGLAKKVLIANAMGELCDIFRSSNEKSVVFYWVYAVAFTLQIYFDFSGYSDMAIGLGHIFGFRFPENFDYPYESRSVTEFWRRWHMTLGSWFRDYVYIPLGGNRVAKWKWVRNILVVWLLTGLWHGASWNFVVWGGLFGVLLLFEKLWFGRVLEKSGRVLPHIYVMLIVTLSFVIFNGAGMAGAWQDLLGIFGLGGVPFSDFETLYYLKSYAVLLIIAVVGATSLGKRLWERVRVTAAGTRAMAVLEPAAVAVLLVAVTACLVDGSFNPFLYFRF